MHKPWHMSSECRELLEDRSPGREELDSQGALESDLQWIGEEEGPL